LAVFTFEEIQALAGGVATRKENGPSDTGTFRQLRDEMQHFNAGKVGDLPEITIISYEVMLGLRDPVYPLDDF
jgi:hypothetical protein